MKKNEPKPTTSEVTAKLKKQRNLYFVPDFGQIEAADNVELAKKVKKLRKDKEYGNK
ncbi:hypothetical protein [Rhodococcus qingshengii]|uniref:hypothetical protein n=1 Tax=Rhodococcus qingshengii TaxID=334542 RepID=UPI002941DF1A|nr:hypothetical protein [Rhodococcus qingshengii]WOI85995.1 hypothetical protein R0122_22715 [Rhodococcus qingshengii]